MRAVLALAVLLGVEGTALRAVPSRITKKDQARADKQMLQGSWVMVRWQRGSSVVVYNPTERFYVWTIRADKLSAQQGALGWHVESTFTVDPAKQPGALDAVDLKGTPRSKTERYIYAVEGNTLTIGYDGIGKPRPKGFTGAATTVVVFQKVPAQR